MQKIIKTIIKNIEDYKENEDHTLAIDAGILFDFVLPKLSNKKLEQLYNIFSGMDSLDIFDSGEAIVVTHDDLDAIIDDFKKILICL